MNLYRTSESGLVAVQPLDPAETDGLAGALLRGPGGALGAEDVLFVTTAVGDGAATALGVDATGDVVVLGAADGEVGSETVTNALQSASAAADQPYDALDDRFEGEGSLQAAHADYFDQEPLAPEAFNDDQRVRLLGAAFDRDALDLATFLSDRDVPVDPVRVEAFGDPESEAYLVRFEPVDRESGAGESDESVSEESQSDGGSLDADESGHWIAGASASESASATESTPDGGTATQSSDDADTGDPSGHQSALTDAAAEGDESDEQGDTDESIELPVLLEAVSEGIQERLVGTFDEDAEDIVSVERGNELVVRPDHPAYAGGVLRYRLRAESDGRVEFEVNIYGGSEAEKEQMRAVIRENEAAIEAELGYAVSDRYDGFHASREFPQFDQVTAAEIVDEFDRLVRFFHPRVMRA